MTICDRETDARPRPVLRRAVLQLLAATALGGCRGGCARAQPVSEERDEDDGGGAVARVAFVASVRELWEKTGAPPRITRIDTARAKVDVFRELAETDRVEALALSAEALWAGGVATAKIHRLDPRTLETRGEIAIERSEALAASAGKLYAASVRAEKKLRLNRRAGDATLFEIDPARGVVARSLALPGVLVGRLAATNATIWALSAFDAPPPVVLEIDRARLEVRRRHDVGVWFDDLAAGPMDAALGHGALWLGCQRLHGSRVVPWLVSLRSGASSPTKVEVDLHGVDTDEHLLMCLAWSAGRVWASGEKHQPTIAIDPTTGRATQVKGIPYGTEQVCPLAANADGVWMAAGDDDSVFGIDVAQARSTRRLAIGTAVAIVAG